MNFRKAYRSEAGKIKELYGSVTGMPFCTWNEYYPGEEELEGDLSAGTLYVLSHEDRLIGAVSAVPENEMDDLECWKIRDNVREVARLVIMPEYQGKGLSKLLVEGIISEFQTQGIRAVHLSVAKKNIPAQKLYQKMNFDFCGQAEMYSNSYYLCEKEL